MTSSERLNYVIKIEEQIELERDQFIDSKLKLFSFIFHNLIQAIFVFIVIGLGIFFINALAFNGFPSSKNLLIYGCLGGVFYWIYAFITESRLAYDEFDRNNISDEVIALLSLAPEQLKNRFLENKLTECGKP